MNRDKKLLLIVALLITVISAASYYLVFHETKKDKPVKATTEQVSGMTEDQTEAEVEKLEWGSRISPQLKEALQPQLRTSDEKYNTYVVWFKRHNGFTKGYYITVDRDLIVTKLETKLEAGE